MSRLMIIGCGGVASVAIHKCCQNSDVFTEIMIASRTVSKCDALKEKLQGTTKTKITTAKVDADNVDELVALMESYKPDAVLNVAPPYQDLTIMEGSWVGDKTEESFEVCGYRMLSEQYGVPLIDAQKEKSMPVQCGDMELQICECAKKVDFMINVPVMKGHCQTKITCALKNMKGLLPNKEKRHFHAMGLHRPIAHLGLGIHQDFILVDNICGDLDFEDGGNPFIMNRLFAGLDPVLIDAYVCAELHYKPEDVPYVKMAEELGVGSADLTRLSIRQIGEIGEKRVIPEKRKIVELQDAVEEVESCSACYGYLIPALDRLKEEGLLQELHEKICIGQGYRGKSGALGVGSCTSGFKYNLKGCPPTDEQMYEFLKQYIATRRKTEAEK